MLKLDPDAKEALRIIGLTVLAAAIFGFLHDSVTARISLAYFTVGHDMPFQTTNPNLVALIWGVVATWWLALPLGIMIAACALVGRRPTVTWRELRQPLALLVTAGLVISWLVGVHAYLTSSAAQWADHEYGGDNGHRNYVCYQMHTASYIAMPSLTLVLGALLLRRRAKLSR